MPVWLWRIGGPVYEVTDDYGGFGGAGGGGSKQYFYLVVRGNDPGRLSSSDVKSFFRSGVNTTSDYVFVFIDIASDQRLANDLRRHDGGPKLLQEIYEKAPVFLLSSQRIPVVADLKGIEVIEIKDYDKDVTKIYDKMGVHSLSTRKAAIFFLKRVNKYLHLKPNLAGVGVNLNDFFADLLDKLESISP